MLHVRASSCLHQCRQENARMDGRHPRAAHWAGHLVSPGEDTAYACFSHAHLAHRLQGLSTGVASPHSSPPNGSI
eukprot:338937-Pelagomonas_calceolata.AAC.1